MGKQQTSTKKMVQTIYIRKWMVWVEGEGDASDGQRAKIKTNNDSTHSWMLEWLLLFNFFFFLFLLSFFFFYLYVVRWMEWKRWANEYETTTVKITQVILSICSLHLLPATRHHHSAHATTFLNSFRLCRGTVFVVLLLFLSFSCFVLLSSFSYFFFLFALLFLLVPLPIWYGCLECKLYKAHTHRLLLSQLTHSIETDWNSPFSSHLFH